MGMGGDFLQKIAYWCDFYSEVTMEGKSGPPLVQLPYEEEDIRSIWSKCVQYHEHWNVQSKSSPNVTRKMNDFRTASIVSLVWMSNKLEGTLPEGATESETRHSLRLLLNAPSTTTLDWTRDSCAGVSLYSSNIDEDQTGKRQLLQHMEAYRRLERAVDDGEELSEKLIMEAHGMLMKGLENYGQPVTAGSYRLINVHADNHQYPDNHSVPIEMPSIVSEYNTKFSDPDHDPYQLASWLLYEVISLHPFEDGNGRLCRLLWCYSLMRDGLPFPTVLTSGHRKAHKHFIDALKKSSRVGIMDHPHLTSLTVLSIHNTWETFSWDNKET